MEQSDIDSRVAYAKSHLKQVLFRLHNVYDADIIAFLDGMENRQGELKQILREEMARRSVGVTD